MVLIGHRAARQDSSARHRASREHGRRIHRLVRHVRARLEGRVQGAGRDLERDRRRDLAGAVGRRPTAAPAPAQTGTAASAAPRRTARPISWRTICISAAATSSRSAARRVCAARSTTSSRRRRRTRTSRARTPASPTSYALLPLYANVRVDSLMPLAHVGDQPRGRSSTARWPKRSRRARRCCRPAGVGPTPSATTSARSRSTRTPRQRTNGTASCCCSTGARPRRRRSSTRATRARSAVADHVRFVRARARGRATAGRGDRGGQARRRARLHARSSRGSCSAPCTSRPTACPRRCASWRPRRVSIPRSTQTFGLLGYAYAKSGKTRQASDIAKSLENQVGRSSRSGGRGGARLHRARRQRAGAVAARARRDGSRLVLLERVAGGELLRSDQRRPEVLGARESSRRGGGDRQVAFLTAIGSRPLWGLSREDGTAARSKSGTDLRQLSTVWA